MNTSIKDSLDSIRMSLPLFGPEFLLTGGIVFIIVAGLIWKNRDGLMHIIASLVLVLTFASLLQSWNSQDAPVLMFTGMIRLDSFTTYMRFLFTLSGLLTVFLTWQNEWRQGRLSEYYALILGVILGANLLVMSENLMMVFVALELVSICSYVLTGFAFTRNATEGSLKYFLFGSVASAVMLYGFSLLYGITGTLGFTTIEFVQSLIAYKVPLFFIAGVFSLAGFLYKVAAVPMHPWAPDVYEAAPMPVVGFFSVVPKLAGIGILTKFIQAINLYGQSAIDWQIIVAMIAILTLTVGNFSALWQKNVKRMMAYSSIAQSGFLLTGLLAFSHQGIQFLLFYSTIYMVMNFLVFAYLQAFENGGATTIADFAGAGRGFLWPSVFMLVGFVSLTGLPPTAGFTAKLFIFSALWEAYAASGKSALMWLLVFGLLNTVVSLFYYLRIPFYAFVRSSETPKGAKNLTALNLLGAILVLLVLSLFFSPALLMGWINKITFVF